MASGQLKRRRIRLLEREEVLVRCGAVRKYKERQTNRSRGVAAQRTGDDDTVWMNLVRQVKRDLALCTELG